MTTDNSTQQTAHLVLPENNSLNRTTIEQLEQALPDGTDLSLNHFETLDHPDSESWHFDAACPHCGEERIITLRGKEELLTIDSANGELQYDGTPHGTSALQTETLLAWCSSCDEVLHRHPAMVLLRTDVL